MPEGSPQEAARKVSQPAFARMLCAAGPAADLGALISTGRQGCGTVGGTVSRKPCLAELYHKYLDDQDLAGFIAGVGARYTPATLERLAAYPDREVRRAAVMALGFLGDYQNNQVLGQALVDEDRMVRMLADNAIRSVWLRVGSPAQRQQLGIIARLVVGQRYEDAIARASSLLEQAEWLAEAWYQRGVAEFHLRRYAEAVRDCHETLELNPYHFLAAVIMGQAYLELGNRSSALEAFRRALKLNPDLEGVRQQVARLTQRTEDH